MKQLSNIGLLVILVVVYSCSSTNSLSKVEELSLSKLQEKKLVAFNADYFSNIKNLKGYHYDNSSDDFNEIQGDFFNLSLGIDSSINIMPSHFRNYRNLNNNLIIVVRQASNTKGNILNMDLSVKSSSFGSIMNKSSWSDTNNTLPAIVFSKPIDLTEQNLTRLKTDTLTVTIDSKSFRFINSLNSELVK